MQKPLPAWAFGVLTACGAILVGSMLVNWVDFGVRLTGLGLAWEANHWLFLVPVAGAVLAAHAAKRSPHTRLAAIFAGTVITGYVLFDITTSMIHSGLDTWLILGGAGAMLAGATPGRATWRGVGGAAVLVGFFAPWADVSMWNTLTSQFADFTGIGVRILWLVPLAGLTGVISAGNQITGAKLAAMSGIAIYGSLLYVIGSVAYLVFGIGAWAALGASTVALVIGVLAQVSTKREPAQLPA